MVAIFAAKRKASTDCVTVNAIRMITAFAPHIGLACLFTDSDIGLIDRRNLSIVCIHCPEYIGELEVLEGLLRMSSA